MRLPQQLRRMRERSNAEMSPEAREALRRMVGDLKARGAELKAVRAGMPVPRFALPDAQGRTVDIAERLARGPVILSFYRGGWCPYCNAELRALQFALPQFRGLGASLVALSPELPDHSLSLAEKLALDFDILSDTGNMVARQWGLVYRVPDDVQRLYQSSGLDLSRRNGDASWELPIPATYLIGGDGFVRLAFVDADFTERLDPAVLVDALRSESLA